MNNQREQPSGDHLPVVNLGRLQPYGPVWDLQRRLVAARQAGSIGDRFLVVEHKPVYTLGRHAEPGNVLWDERARSRYGIELYKIDRGGDVTYHGPGQIVGYPIINLRDRKLGVRQYVQSLEAALVEVCKQYGVEAETVSGLPGVWVEDRKIAAIGIRCSRGVTSHGFAFNVQPEMRHFAGILPCGLAGKGVTSLAAESGIPLDWERCLKRVIDAVARKLGYGDWIPVELDPQLGAEQIAQ